jgi:hypothetical protein
VIEGKYRDVDLLHHRSQKRRRLDRPADCFMEQRAEGVDLQHHLAKGIVVARAPGAKGIVPLPERHEEVGHRLERPYDPLADGQRESEPASQDQQGDRAVHIELEWSEPQSQTIEP